MNRDAFASYHPIINFAFFCSVIIFGMIFLHPVFLGVAFLGALSYAIYLKGKSAVKFVLSFMLPMMILAAFLNPLFNHQGVTVLFFFRDNPVTLEAFVYGWVSAFMFATVILWFYCYNEVMTSDKFMFLFGRVIPSMSLIFSMVLRFIPNFKAQIKIISDAQKCIGRDVSNGSVKEKFKHGIKIMSIMTTQALENSVHMADSMKSRGYGLKGRTSYSTFRFDRRDTFMGIFFLVAIGLVIVGAIMGQNTIEYYPTIVFAKPTPLATLLYGGYALLCFTPVIVNFEEDLKWKRLLSEI